MKRDPLMVLILTVFLLGMTNTSVAGANDEKEFEAAVQQFYSALNTMFTGDVEPMKAIWSHASDVTYMGPAGGLHVGWDAVAIYWEAQAARKLGGRVDPVDMQFTVGRDIAVTSNFERGQNTNAAGESHEVNIRATNIFRKEDGEWKMIGHHTDLLPYLAN